MSPHGKDQGWALVYLVLQLESALVLCLIAEIGKVRHISCEGTSENQSKPVKPSLVCLVSGQNFSSLS